MRPDPTEFAPYYSKYIDLVPESDILAVLQQQSSETQKLLASLDEDRASYRYEPDKWSVKQLFGHLLDSERVFGYRAVAIARGETASLPSFEADQYVENGAFDSWRVGDIAECYALSRRANVVSFSHFSDEAWIRQGLANNNRVTPRAVAFTMVGHERHHLNVLKERYRIG